MEKGIAIITGADGGMGQEITLALAKDGFQIIMACKEPEKARPVCERIKKESGNEQIEVREIDLSSLSSVYAFAQKILAEGHPVSRLMNNAGVLTTNIRPTTDGLETIVSVNYVGPYLLTRLLLPLMHEGTRIVNTVSCTYAIGKIESDFFIKGKNGRFNRISVYGNTKLALLLFTRELAKRVKEKGITVNASDPGIVSTNMITMNAWFDPLTDILFRPFIKTPLQGAATAIHLALSEDVNGKSGGCYANCKEKKLSERILNHPAQSKLWDDTDALLRSHNLLD
ncbi:SDR family oxidoreductase [Parabacteroides timonensis]|uniref:SDR family oxidoreductase n=1 Tax=Parabacteroides timonensis TaxID=1871013 RepID=UPI00094F3472|nr:MULTISPECIES: SDR family oxidoreductase [Parabacteroides]